MPIPNIPDSRAKFILTISFVVMAGVLYSGYQLFGKSFERLELLNRYKDSVEYKMDQITFNSRNYLDDIKSQMDSTCSSCKISISDSSILVGTFPPNIRAKLLPIFKTFQRDKFSDTLDIAMYNKFIKRLKDFSFFTASGISLIIFWVLGGSLLMLGRRALISNERKAVALERRKLIGKPEYYSSCQSCAKTFSSMLKHGREADGSLNEAFCLECYNAGNFLDDVSLLEFLLLRKAEISSYSKNTRKLIIKQISDSERWQKPYNIDEY